MAYDEGLAQRISEILEERADFVEKKMFGGLCFLLNGNMACGIIGDEIVVRVGPKAYEASLAEPYARKFDFTGRPMRGLVMVSSEACDTDETLDKWVEKGVTFALSLMSK